MEGGRRPTRNSRRMDPEREQLSSPRRGRICRHFLNGSCRFGARCNYLHEWRVAPSPSPQICRFFQKGGCWYGERCRYIHVLQPEGDTAVAGRRRSVPAVSSSSSSSSFTAAAHAPSDRRGSEPALLQAAVTPRWESSTSASAFNVSTQHNSGPPAAGIAEEQSQDANCGLSGPRELVRRSAVAQADACDGGKETSSYEDVGAAAGSGTQKEVEASEASRQSRDVTCGICMDKVYEKPDPKDQMFGLLPNCNHSFCLQCIMTWRKTRDLGPDVVKTCPQCRVRSAFYVPHKYWVEGRAKDVLIAAFKEKFSKKSCSYYARYRCCPFKSECLYRHDKAAHSGSFTDYHDDDDDDDDIDGLDLLNFFIAMALGGGGGGHEDHDIDFDLDFPLFQAEEYGF